MSLVSKSDESRSGSEVEEPVQGKPEVSQPGQGRASKRELDDGEEKPKPEELSRIERELDAEIEKMKMELEAGPSMKETMDQLHEYNEIKDAAQMVLGAIASMHGVTIASLHKEHDLPLGEE